MNKRVLSSGSPSTGWWILAYAISPGLPFICLRLARVVSLGECLLGVAAGLAAHMGVVTVLAHTDDEPLQPFIGLLLGVSMSSVLLWQYLAGRRRQFWSAEAEKRWQWAGRILGGLLGFALVLNIVIFHLREP